ncbi:alpha/beta hydrolase family protein [Halomonas ventosae]|uniref:Dipeptidyl aminopeptidase/acylaminoacyl peptidase n=1 Tax=Halomonas ventosae TaxID=229007 RepID=A0A2T0VA80_9GAMM|nr:prolyl oligopeptidase family serine peptidase [Halomonas ventosae]PRY67092.1 dipeptidyl aminopeptidase/acylaminoacyl peptidase [Halomonas ventosae]
MTLPPAGEPHDDLLRRAALPADGLGDLRATPRGVLWLAADPETGRRRLWQWHDRLEDGRPQPLSPEHLDIASRVNGYGGGALACLDEHAIFVEADSQDLHRQPLSGGEASPWWSRHDSRYGGLTPDPRRRRLLAVEESGQGRDARQRLVALDGRRRRVLDAGADFYGAPALSPCGTRLAWVEWDLGDMPWQRSRLRQARLDAQGTLHDLALWDAGAAITQPRFTAANELIVLSDHGGWWQPYRVTGPAESLDIQRLGTRQADHASTPWQLGECQHLWPTADQGVIMAFEVGAARILVTDGEGREHAPILRDAGRLVGLAHADGWLYAITQGARHAARLSRVNLTTHAEETLFALPTPEHPPLPRRLQATVADGERVPAFLYGPGPASSRPPPLIVRVHGGPTSACYPVFDPLVHYWTQHGFAVADINPRGSANAGRAYRERLAGEWGRIDVEDVIALTRSLVARGLADPARLFVRGQSAGGFTVLNLLATTCLFRAGASLYGVTDAPHLATRTHRFECGYLDWLLGDAHTQRACSPIHRLDAFATPVIFFQGNRDTVVVPEQTLAMAEALRRRGVPARVMLFEDEGHGIRQPHNRCRLIAAEMQFFLEQGDGRG